MLFSFTGKLPYTPGNSHRSQSNGRLSGPKAGPDALERKEFETRIVQPVA